MSKIIIYTLATCPFCLRAKRLLEEKGATYTEISIDGQSDVKLEMEKLSGRTSVPQIFIDERHIGGCDDLYALDAAGQLDELLK